MRLRVYLVILATLALIGCSEEDGLNYSPGLEYDYAPPVIGGAADTTQQEQYLDYIENSFISTTDEPISTFSIDADGGSYANVRRYLSDGQLPPKGAVRLEEFINYFPYDYEHTGSAPVALNGEVSSYPWTPGNRLIRVGIQGQKIAASDLPPSNLVFLIDVSGSMSQELPLVKHGLELLVNQLGASDRIALATYAGSSQLVLPSTACSEKSTILAAIESLESGGGTNGSAGIETAYEIATENFITGGNNRVLLVSDGDFNIGTTSRDELIALIEEKRETGVYLTVVGTGTGNYNEALAEQLANKGNGTYEYLDSERQAQKIFVDEFSKFYTVAEDVKVQVEFNPAVVQSYRLLGYENRLLSTEDFEDDGEDAGEIGANQSITALYEIVPTTTPNQSNAPTFTIDFRYKLPGSESSLPMSLTVQNTYTSFADASRNMRFAATAAGFGMQLIDSQYDGNLTYDDLIEWSSTTGSYDPQQLHGEFVSLLEQARDLQ